MPWTIGQKVAVGVGMALTVASWVGVGVLAPRMSPVERETSADFWESVAAVDLTGGGMQQGMIAAEIRDDGAWVYSPGMDDNWVWYVPREEVLRDFPRVIKALADKSADAANHTDAVEGYRRWQGYVPGEEGGPNGLVEGIEDARRERLLNTVGLDHPLNAYLGAGGAHEELGRVAEKWHRYWATVLFEVLFFPALIWFFLWPGVRGRGVGRWLVHGAVTPFLALAPLWLGYCVMTREPIGPYGGVLYPWMVWVLQPLRFDANAGWEMAFFRALPKVCEPLSQGLWDDRVMYEPSWAGMVYTTGPLQAVIAAGGLCAIILAWAYAPAVYRAYRQWRPARSRRGFEILPRE
ncbi:MAG TPA: hypothetical protein VH253_02370 [Phycisphaerae bacterium]|nr:hypothetical protein [Phycisphaerae bacterium]